MKKIIIISAIVLSAAALILMFVLVFNASDTVVIKSGGEIVRTIELSRAEDCIMNIDSGHGTNTVVIKDHKIYVSDADCPDKICVKTGELKYSFLPIICLPNKLEIAFVSGADAIDAAAG